MYCSVVEIAFGGGGPGGAGELLNACLN